MSELQTNTIRPRTGSTVQVGTTGAHKLTVGDALNAADLDVKGNTQLRGGLDCNGAAEFDSTANVSSTLTAEGNITCGGNIDASSGTVTCDTLVATNFSLGGSGNIQPIFAAGHLTIDGTTWEADWIEGCTVSTQYMGNLGRWPKITFDDEQDDTHYVVLIQELSVPKEKSTTSFVIDHYLAGGLPSVPSLSFAVLRFT